MIERCRDTEYLNRILNHPAVYPWVHGHLEGPLDMTPVIEDPKTILLKVTGGAFFAVWQSPGIYEVHTQFLPGFRAIGAAQECARYMFIDTDCEVLVTMVPRNNVIARKLTERMQFEFLGERGEWPTPDGDVPLDAYALTVKRWVQTRFSCQQQSL